MSVWGYGYKCPLCGWTNKGNQKYLCNICEYRPNPEWKED